MQGKPFRLNTATVALVFHEEGKQVMLEIPAGDEILVLDPVPTRPTTDRTERVNIRWNERTASIFLADLQERGDRVLD
jgi:hypothetical protein